MLHRMGHVNTKCTAWHTEHRLGADGATHPCQVPLRQTLERLIVGTDAKNKYIRFQIIRFDKHLETPFIPKGKTAEDITTEAMERLRSKSWEYTGDKDMDRYEGISFTPNSMRKIVANINRMMRKEDEK